MLYYYASFPRYKTYRETWPPVSHFLFYISDINLFMCFSCIRTDKSFDSNTKYQIIKQNQVKMAAEISSECGGKPSLRDRHDTKQ